MRSKEKVIALILSMALMFPSGMSVVKAQDDVQTENVVEKVEQLEETANEIPDETTENLSEEPIERAADVIDPQMTEAEVKQVIANAADTILVEAGTYSFALNFNSGKNVSFAGDVTVQGAVTFNNCMVDGNGYTLTVGTGTGKDGLDIAGESVTIENITIIVNSSRFNYSTWCKATTVNFKNATLNSSNNPQGAGMFISPSTTTINTTDSDLIMCGNGNEQARSGIWSDADGSKNIIFNMVGGTLQLDNNGLNGFLGTPAPIFGGNAPTPTFNLHNVNVSASGNGASQDEGSRGDGFSYGYINLISDTGEHTFNVNGNSNNGIDGGRGNNCAFNAVNYTINANDNGNYGIHISKKTSDITNCDITASRNGNTGFYSRVNTTLKDSVLTAENNGQQGVEISSGTFVTNNSTVSANANKQNGIKVTGNTTFNTSNVTADGNIKSGIYTSKSLNVASDSTLNLMLNTSDASGKGALYVYRGTAVIQKGAEVYIAKNLQSGVYVNKNASADVQTGEITENGYIGKENRSEIEITAVSGGGVFNNGTFTMGEDARIHNNYAIEKGDDVYNVEGASLTLIDEPESFGLILMEDMHAIDGWYYDGKGDPDTSKDWDGVRWDARIDTADEELYYNQEKENLERTDEVALKATHGLVKYTVTINFLEDGSNKVLRDQVVSGPTREGKLYDVSAYEKTQIDGYTYVRTDGDAYTGTLDSDKVINLYYRKAPADSTDNNGGNNTDSGDKVDTGDHSNIMLWSIIAMISALGIVAALGMKRRRIK